ncbi:MAG TPA: molybdopterin-dependent oxidoreductase [Syntrophales bacterium]|nr:molybdopterin-dependent oxidoreductase [Syntrophales bacterium]
MKKVVLTINGIQRQFHVDSDRVLLDLLREDLRQTGTKQSCDRKGQCGACTVIVNGKTVRSCITKAEKLDGANVITIEGLGTPQNPHLIQEAFVLAGAVQCGFCIPGMIMAAKALLDRNINPAREEIKKALQRNFCRCTGYVKIIDAVVLAGRFLRGEVTPDQVRPTSGEGHIGISLPRPTSMVKACGVAEFTADIFLQGALELAAVRSPHNHALIKSIDTSLAEKMPGVVGVITAKDIKGTNRLKMIVDDQPLLCDRKVFVMGNPVAAVVADTKKQALAAAKMVRVEYELLAEMKKPEEAMAPGAPQIHEGRANVCLCLPQVKGDAEKALASSHAVVEADFSTQLIHQSPLEPEAAIAYLESGGDDAKLVVIGRGINIHQSKMVLQDALGWDNIRYEEAFAGGQFGIKLDITAEGLAAAAALHFKRPVRYICSLEESMWISTKRHPVTMKVRLGADRLGKLTAYCIDFIMENGAFTSVGYAILLRCLQMLSGGYNIPNVKAEGKLVYTNNAWGGAARGAGPPQTNFALESAMTMLAMKLGMDPLEFRLLNSLKIGETTSTGQVVEEWPFPGCLEAIRPHYERAKKECSTFPQGRIRRGVGVAGGAFGIGPAGPGDKANIAVELNPDGGLTVYGGVADPGEGNDSMLTQIAAHAMGIPMEKVRLVIRDTDRTPYSGSASGSRVTYMCGNALLSAIDLLKRAMSEAKATSYDQLVAAGKPTRYQGTKVQMTTPLDPKTGQGVPYESRVFGVQLAEVEIDTETGEVKILKMTAVVDVGKVIHPQNVEGQIEGGLDMGAGMALREQYVHGVTKDYIQTRFPTMGTSFETEIIILETPRKKGPLGAVGVGEFVLLPTNAAIADAICDATGVRIRHLPARPERVLAALAGGRA